jgi:hypothetical protein
VGARSSHTNWYTKPLFCAFHPWRVVVFVGEYNIQSVQFIHPCFGNTEMLNLLTDSDITVFQSKIYIVEGKLHKLNTLTCACNVILRDLGFYHKHL